MNEGDLYIQIRIPRKKIEGRLWKDIRDQVIFCAGEEFDSFRRAYVKRSAERVAVKGGEK